MKLDSKILICYNSPVSIYSDYSGKKIAEGKIGNDSSETGFSEEIELLESSIKKYFADVQSITVDTNISKVINKIIQIKPDAIFNLVESVEGISAFESYFAGLIALLNIQFTGNTPQTLGNCLDKAFTKKILEAHKINTPKSIVYSSNNLLTENKFKLNFPVITKLLKEDASIGISENSVVKNFEAIEKQLLYLSSTFKQEILIEEYIDGREFNVAILGGRALPISEIIFDGLPEALPKIVTYEGKWMAESIYFKHTTPSCPANIDATQKKMIEKIALKAYSVLDCRDYARVDIRLNEKNIPYVIEVNPNPDISSDSGFARAAKADGLSYAEFILQIVKYPLEREINDSKATAV
ncbi:MAG: D-alanine--D-alanine ligase [Chlorobiaceae bacterium]|nr:D-alanine--D-alanine ligase [Chlorobiaceae bacterium]MBA4309136.1 D-alanine--D-alanine ligase [Chlorobiaceae bacterium]